MFKHRLGVRSVVALLIFTLVVSAFGFVAAQDNSAAPFLGVGLGSADKGVKVEQVQTGSPADKAGVKVGDVITAIDTKAVTSDSIRDVIAGHKVGDVITLSLTRGSDTLDVKVTLGARPAAEATAEAPASGDRPVLGVQLENTDKGPTIRDVVAGSPAEKAGLKVGDILTKIGDTAVKDAESASKAVQALKVGDEVSIEVTRDGKTVTVEATLAAGASVTEPSVPTMPMMTDRPMLGVQLEDSDKGAVVRSVVADSPAEKAGLKVGDILTKIGDTTVKDAQSASKAVQALKVGDEVSIEVTRDGKIVTVKATLAAAPMMNLMQHGNGMGITFNATDKSWTISGLPEDSDLYKAGLREGDTITKFDGTAYDPAALTAYLAKVSAADVTLTVTRDGKDQEIKVPVTALKTFGMGVLGGMHFGDEPFFNMPFDMMGGGSRLGVQFVTLDPSVAKEHNVTETVGALVTKVMPQSPADKAGLKTNDVVTAVNGDTVNAEHTLRDLLATHAPGDSVKLDVIRDGKTSQFDVTLDQMPMSDSIPFFNFGQGGANGFQFDIPTPQPTSPLESGSAM